MAETVRILIDVDAKGTPKIQALERSFATLRRELEQTEFRSRRSALAQIERSVAQTRNAIAAQRREFVNFAGQINRELVTIATRMTRTFAFTAVAGIGAATAALVKMTGQFIKVNEEFRGLEITLRSSFKSLSIARQLRDEIAQITAFSPLPFQSIAQATRAFSVIPFTRNEIAQQVGGTGNVQDQNGFFRSMIRVVEQLVALRPDKTTGDAVFAIRELLTGEFRSLIRRFDVPISLLTSAGGKSILELKEDPRAAFNALQKGFGQLITPQAVEALARQPKILFENLIEQVIQIPLLRAGTLPLQGGRGEQGAFDTIIDEFFSTFLRLNDFVSKKINPFAVRIGQAFVDSFDVITRSMGEALEGILSLAGFGESDILDQDLIGRAFTAVTASFEKLPTVLDKVIKKFTEVSSAIVHLFQEISPLLSQVYNIGKTLFSLFTDSPVITSFALLFSRTLPAILTEAFRDMADKLTTLWTNKAVNPMLSQLNLNNIEPKLESLSDTQQRQLLKRNIRVGANGDAFLRASAPSALFSLFNVARSGFPGIDTPLGKADFRTRFAASGLDENRAIESLRFAQSGRVYLRNLTGVESQFSQALGAQARPGITGVQIGKDIVKELSPVLNKYIEKTGNQFRVAANTPSNVASVFGRNSVPGSIIASNIAAPIVAEAERKAQQRAAVMNNAGQILNPGQKPLLARMGSIVGSLAKSIGVFAASMALWTAGIKIFEFSVNALSDYSKQREQERLKYSRSVAAAIEGDVRGGSIPGSLSSNTPLSILRLLQDADPDINRNISNDTLKRTLGFAPTLDVAERITTRTTGGQNSTREETIRKVLSTGVGRDDRVLEDLIKDIEESARTRQKLLSLLKGDIREASVAFSGEIFDRSDTYTEQGVDTIRERINTLANFVSYGIAEARKVLPEVSAAFTEEEEKKFQTFLGEFTKLYDIQGYFDQVKGTDKLSVIAATARGTGQLPAIEALNQFSQAQDEIAEPFRDFLRNSESLAEFIKTNAEALTQLNGPIRNQLSYDASRTEASGLGPAVDSYRDQLGVIQDNLREFISKSPATFLEREVSILGESISVAEIEKRLGSLLERSENPQDILNSLVEQLKAPIVTAQRGLIEKLPEVLAQGVSGFLDQASRIVSPSRFNDTVQSLTEGLGPVLEAVGVSYEQINQLSGQFSQAGPQAALTARRRAEIQVSQLKAQQSAIESLNSSVLSGEKIPTLDPTELQVLQDQLAVQTNRLFNRIEEQQIQAEETLRNITRDQTISNAASGFQKVFEALANGATRAGQVALSEADQLLRTIGSGIDQQVQSVVTNGRNVGESIEQYNLRVLDTLEGSEFYDNLTNTLKIIASEYEGEGDISNAAQKVLNIINQKRAEAEDAAVASIFSLGANIASGLGELSDNRPDFKSNSITARRLQRTLGQLGLRADFSQILGRDTTTGVTGKVDQTNDLLTITDRVITDAENRLEKLSGANYETLENSILELERFREKLILIKEEIQGRGGLLGSFKDGFRTVVEEWKEGANNLSAIGASVAESFAGNFSSGFSDFILGLKSAEEAFRSFARNFLEETTRLFTQKAVQALFGNILSGIFAAPSTGGPTFSQSFGPSQFADGGMLTQVGRGGVPNALIMGGEYVFRPDTVGHYGPAFFDALNKRKLDRNQLGRLLPTFATGGIFSGYGSVNMGSGVRDDVPANLPRNSYVLTKSAVQYYGEDLLRGISSQNLPRFADGGLVGSSASNITKPETLRQTRAIAQTQVNQSTVSVPITVQVTNQANGQATASVTAQQQQSTAQGRAFQKAIEEVVMNMTRNGELFSSRQRGAY